jgi:hypothetical protein
MKQAEPSLKERVGRIHRRLLLLQQMFQLPRDDEEPFDATDHASHAALSAAVREVLDELTEHARVLTSVPFPVSEWRPGDTRDDERWRALTEVERREVLSLVSGYDNLIGWAEQMAGGQLELASLIEVSGGNLANQRLGYSPVSAHETADFLKAERARVTRFRQEMRFLTRRSD